MTAEGEVREESMRGWKLIVCPRMIDSSRLQVLPENPVGIGQGPCRGTSGEWLTENYSKTSEGSIAFWYHPAIISHL
jgi:hypothetical protein